MDDNSRNRYKALIEKIFFDRYKQGATEVPFERSDLVTAASALKITLPKNLGDVIYSLRYRTPMPKRVLATQPKGMEWVIAGAGRAHYSFKLVKINRIVPNQALTKNKNPGRYSADHRGIRSLGRAGVVSEGSVQSFDRCLSWPRRILPSEPSSNNGSRNRPN